MKFRNQQKQVQHVLVYSETTPLHRLLKLMRWLQELKSTVQIAKLEQERIWERLRIHLEQIRMKVVLYQMAGFQLIMRQGIDSSYSSIQMKDLLLNRVKHLKHL